MTFYVLHAQRSGCLWYNGINNSSMEGLKVKRYIAVFAALLMITANLTGFIANVSAEPGGGTFGQSAVQRFSDVPESHWAYKPVHYFRSLGITQGIGNNKFGLGQPVKKSEFITMLVRLMGWQPVETDDSSFSDVGKDKWYHAYIETAASKGAILKNTDKFNPDEYIKRNEMAEAITRSLGYGELAGQLQYLPGEFKDVTENQQYTNMMKDFGISNGVDGVNFQPESTAKKEEAVAMLVRMYDRLKSPLKELHAFYAIKAFDQAGMIKDLSSVSFGWSRLEYDDGSGKFFVATKRSGSSDFYIPEGFSAPLDIAKQANVGTQLSLFASNEVKVLDKAQNRQVGIVEYLLSDNEAQASVIEQLINEASTYFDGVVIDFENLRGQELSMRYGAFLSKLKTELSKHGKKLYVAVHPKRGKGQAYYDGYDYRAIGEIADRVILMAHDYNAVELTEGEMAAGYIDTPLTPIDEIYYALKAITDKNTGVAYPNKVLLQISFDAVQWKRTEGKVINRNAFRPQYTQIKDRLTTSDPASKLKINYSEKLENPWITYYNKEDNTENIIWYEDSRSVEAKIELAKMFGIAGISLWRLGNIPNYDDASGNTLNLNVWQTIKEQME